MRIRVSVKKAIMALSDVENSSSNYKIICIYFLPFNQYLIPQLSATEYLSTSEIMT